MLCILKVTCGLALIIWDIEPSETIYTVKNVQKEFLKVSAVQIY